MAEIFQFPLRDAACGRVHSKRLRRSKPSAAIIELPQNKTTDRRKLRGNPLRDKFALVSPAVTIIGKIYTADLRQDGWWDTAITENWLQTLEGGAAAARYVADELDKRAKSISMAAKYDGLPLEEKQIVSAEVDRLLRERAHSATEQDR
jgi:hypothetical protein